MKKETGDIINDLKEVLEGSPWYGKAVYALLQETDQAVVYKKPAGSPHALIDILYHMVTWTIFTVDRVAKKETVDPASFETLDWRFINPAIHTWEKGLEEFKKANAELLDLLKNKSDDFLDGIVEFRTYNFRHLLNGLIQHHIYHAGQIALLNKMEL